jgi:hypothetical protein
MKNEPLVSIIINCHNGEKYLKDDLTKIWNSYYQLTNEEELLIKQIANKL